MLNETFNKVPVEQEHKDDDTITYMSANNGRLLLMMIKKEFNLNKIIMKFYWQDNIREPKSSREVWDKTRINLYKE